MHINCRCWVTSTSIEHWKIRPLSLSCVTKIDRWSLNQADVWHRVSHFGFVQLSHLCTSGHLTKHQWIPPLGLLAGRSHSPLVDKDGLIELEQGRRWARCNQISTHTVWPALPKHSDGQTLVNVTVRALGPLLALKSFHGDCPTQLE